MPTLIAQPPSKDTFIALDDPDGNYGTLEFLWITNQEDTKQRGLLSFDISSIPAGVRTVSATLSLHCYQILNNSFPVWCYKLTQPTWVEIESTWNIYKTASSWDTAGGDFVTSSPSGDSATPSSGSWTDWDITSIVQDAVDNAIDVHLLLKALTEAVAVPFNQPRFRSGEYTGDITQRPKLTITYTLITGYPKVQIF